jgi:hypothetical protein
MLAAISIRQNFPLLIYKANFGDSKYARLQRLSTSIDRFSASATKHHCPFRGVKRPSARLRYALVEPLSGGVISQVLGANDLRDPPDAGTCDHRRPFVRRD